MEYNTQDRDAIRELYFKTELTLNKFSKTKECYVVYGTLWKMINKPEFYDKK